MLEMLKKMNIALSGQVTYEVTYHIHSITFTRILYENQRNKYNSMKKTYPCDRPL